MPFCVQRKNDGTFCSRRITDDDIDAILLDDRKGWICGPCVDDILSAKSWTSPAPRRAHGLKRRDPRALPPDEDAYEDA